MGLSLLLHRLRKLQKRRESPRRRTRRQSSTTPVHPSVHSFSFPLSFLLSSSLSQFSLPLQLSQQPPLCPSPPEEYFYQRICKYWFRFLAQKTKLTKQVLCSAAAVSGVYNTRDVGKGGIFLSFSWFSDINSFLFFFFFLKRMVCSLVLEWEVGGGSQSICPLVLVMLLWSL